MTKNKTNENPQNDQKNLHKLKSSLVDIALAQKMMAESWEVLQEPKRVSELNYPEVMSPQGTPIRADKLIAQFQDKLPAGKAGMMMDSYSGGGLIGFNQFSLNRTNQLLIDNVFLGYAEYSLLLQNGLLSGMCSTPADKMTAEWIEFIGLGEKDSTLRIKELELEFERLNVKSIFKMAAYYSFAFGGCLIYPHLKQNDIDGNLEKELYLDPSMITKGSLEYLKIIEPIWYVPIRYVTDNPFSKWFYVPEYYAVMGKITHSTRICKVLYNEAPNIIKSQYNFNGIPVLQQALPYGARFTTLSNTITEIVDRLNLTVIKTTLQAIINGNTIADPTLNANAGQNLGTRIRMLNATRNNLGVIAIDKENEDIVNLSMNLQQLDKIWSQAAEFLCIIPKLPATEFLGISPQGFNASGDYERKKYHQHIKNMQESIFKEHLIRIMKMAMLNIWGEIDEDITFNFKKLDTANELEQSTIAVNKSTESSAYFDRGIVTGEEVRTKIATDKDSGWNGLEIFQERDENNEAEEYPDTENLSGWNFGERENTPISKPWVGNEE